MSDVRRNAYSGRFAVPSSSDRIVVIVERRVRDSPVLSFLSLEPPFLIFQFFVENTKHESTLRLFFTQEVSSET
jgi:hypothetical protein